MHTFLYNAYAMKTRITLTIDPLLAKRAKQLAHARKISVSAMIEDYVRSAPLNAQRSGESFSQRWAGKFRVASSSKPDERLLALKMRYGLDD
jgi:Family of unknown function (DUF6364)